MMGHKFKEHGDGVHPPSALVFKNLRAPATTAWGTRRRSRNQRARNYDQPSASDVEHGEDIMQEHEEVDMDVNDANRKRTSDQVTGSPQAKATTGMELSLATRPNGVAVPLSPPPKQDPKRSRLTTQSEKTGSGGVMKNPHVGKNWTREWRPPRWRTARRNECVLLELSGD